MYSVQSSQVKREHTLTTISRGVELVSVWTLTFVAPGSVVTCHLVTSAVISAKSTLVHI